MKRTGPPSVVAASARVCSQCGVLKAAWVTSGSLSRRYAAFKSPQRAVCVGKLACGSAATAAPRRTARRAAPVTQRGRAPLRLRPRRHVVKGCHVHTLLYAMAINVGNDKPSGAGLRREDRVWAPWCGAHTGESVGGTAGQVWSLCVGYGRVQVYLI